MTLRQRWKQTSLPNKLLVTTGALVAFSSVAQLYILYASLSLSNAALEASIESSHNDQRAWIAVESMAITTLEKDKPLKTEVKIINAGKTIAVDVDYPGAVQTSWEQLDVDKFIKKMPEQIHSRTVLFQNIDATIPAETSAPLTAEQVDAVKARRCSFISLEKFTTGTFLRNRTLRNTAGFMFLRQASLKRAASTILSIDTPARAVARSQFFIKRLMTLTCRSPIEMSRSSVRQALPSLRARDSAGNSSGRPKPWRQRVLTRSRQGSHESNR